MISQRALSRSETSTASSRIWTRVRDSISLDHNHFAKYQYKIDECMFFGGWSILVLLWRNDNDRHNDKRRTQEDFFIKIFTSHFIARVRKGLLLWPETLCLSRLLMLNRRPGVHSAGCWLSLLHLISIFSRPQLIRAQMPLRPDVAFPTISRLTPSPTQLNCILTSVLTELYNSSTPTRSPTRSLKSHIWLSSSGNNCHAVHRSLSSGASVYECTMGIFYLVPFRQPISAHAISSHNCHWNVSPPSGASPWNGIFGRVKGQNTTVCQYKGV